MADDGSGFNILNDLQLHLRTAKIPIENLSTLAREGDERPKYQLDTKSLQLVEQFLTDNVKVQGTGPEIIQSQLYIACFWGVKEVVEILLKRGADPNYRNKGTLWTPLHAATFQEHGPILMILLEAGAQPDSKDAENRTPIDFASASDKIWPHFAAMGMRRTTRSELVQMGVLRPLSSHSAGQRVRLPGQGIQMASYDRAEPKYEYNSDPFIHASVTGDVLADVDQGQRLNQQQPQFTMWK